MDKEHILKEIKRTTKENGGVPLGSAKFQNETGIKQHEWRSRHWARWSDALAEAGFSPNTLTSAYDETLLIEKYMALARELNRLPVFSEIQLKRHNDPSFPHFQTYIARFGSKVALVRKLQEYCGNRPGFEDIVALCQSYSPRNESSTENSPETELKLGFVYLLKHGSRREYKIGKTFNPVRREGEILLQLPEKVHPVHYIETDDPSGIEAYWHNRFAEKRKEGEWFELSASDVQAFKKWKRIS